MSNVDLDWNQKGNRVSDGCFMRTNSYSHLYSENKFGCVQS